MPSSVAEPFDELKIVLFNYVSTIIRFYNINYTQNVQIGLSTPDVQSHRAIVCSPLLVLATDTANKYFVSMVNFTMATPILNGDKSVKIGVL